ncbi:SMP-30/gluconolactonase/LRE family protein [Roseomonas populi]|uniref:Major royal jelly family protein n=1 Tax=Roseomonas populi TaxID=3121582 RepID=A0ABT1X6X0_9PROT|nr:major royal jelly family protein [Roseomonas pecuniae]MCR0983491.1 major royal jelly family protein [Roseomonas pecuniae]
MSSTPRTGRRTALLGTAASLVALRTAQAQPQPSQAQAPASPPASPQPAAPGAAPAAGLERVAAFEGQVTGVAVSKDGRMFVCFPRWEKDVEISVAEVGRDGSLKPYPDAEWNAYRNAAPRDLANHLICVQSVTVDPQGFLWILDPAAPGNEFNLPGGVKMLKVDLGSNKVVQTIAFDSSTAPQGAYLNDVRVTPDGRWAFITDSGQRGAIVVVDLSTGKARRVLDGAGPTQPEPDVIVKADGRELRRTDGRPTLFAADGIALDAEGKYLYWQALTGRTLYRIATASLIDEGIAPTRLASSVEKIGTTCVADGYWMDKAGNLYITSPEDDSLKVRRPDGRMDTLVQDKRLRWPDSLAEGPDGAIYVTTSQIQDMARYHEKGATPQQAYALWRVQPAR